MTQARFMGFKCEKHFCDVKHLNDKKPKHSWFIFQIFCSLSDFESQMFNVVSVF